MKPRKQILVIVALALTVLALGVTGAPGPGACSPDECAVLAGLAKLPTSLGQVGTVVGVVNGDKTEIFYYGAVNTSPNAPKPTGTTLFAIGSITKTMTATLLALYDKRGLVHIPGVPPTGKFNPQVERRATLLQEVLPPSYILPCPRKKITLLDLADHHSGLPRNAKDTDTTVADLYTDIATCPGCICAGPACSSCRSPGLYCYSNFGFAILGHVLAGVGHAQTWAELNQSQIMQPLGMADTNVKEGYTAAQNFSGRAATGYMKHLNGQPYPSNPQGPDGEDSPAGGLWSTPNDMMRWLVYNMSQPPKTTQGPSNPNVTTIAMAELLSLLPALHYPRAAVEKGCIDSSDVVNPAQRVGLGWQIAPLAANSPRTVIEKGGSVAGFRAYIGFESASRKGVFVLFNYSAESSDVSQVGRTILLKLP